MREPRRSTWDGAPRRPPVRDEWSTGEDRCVTLLAAPGRRRVQADYTMMGERLANNLLLLSRVWSRHIITYTFLNAHTEESLTPKLTSDLLPW